MAKAKKEVAVQTLIEPYTRDMLNVVNKATGLGDSAILRMALTMYLNNWFTLNNKRLPKVKK